MTGLSQALDENFFFSFARTHVFLRSHDFLFLVFFFLIPFRLRFFSLDIICGVFDRIMQCGFSPTICFRDSFFPLKNQAETLYSLPHAPGWSFLFESVWSFP